MQLTKINGRYELLLPDHRAAREQWDIRNGGWEVERIEEMLDEIEPHHVVFDIGTEEGDITALLQKESGCKMVLFEPNDRVWPCIKYIWEANGLADPLDFYRGFLSDKTTNSSHTVRQQPFSIFGDIDVEKMIPDHGFKQLYENYPDVPQMTLDDYVELTGIIPDVITMDVEGSEWNIIKGAQKTLKEKKPIIFMSVHPEFLYESYRNEGKWKDEYGERCFVVHMLRFIDELGYTHRVIEWDYHECHVQFSPLR
jgi:FkbM family methyltransferase